MAKRTLDGMERFTLGISFPNTFGGDWLPPRVAEGKESLGKPSGLPFSKGIEDREQGVALADPQAVCSPIGGDFEKSPRPPSNFSFAPQALGVCQAPQLLVGERCSSVGLHSIKGLSRHNKESPYGLPPYYSMFPLIPFSPKYTHTLCVYLLFTLYVCSDILKV